MNLEKKLIVKGYSDLIDMMKKECKATNNEKSASLYFRKWQELNRERRDFRLAKKDLKKEILERKKQKRNTLELFKNVVINLGNKIDKEPLLSSHTHTIKSHTHRFGKKLNPYFGVNYINLDLLHSLCYENNVLLTVSIDDFEGTACLNFELSSDKQMDNSEYTILKIINLENMQYFYDNFIDEHMKYYDENDSNDMQISKSK